MKKLFLLFLIVHCTLYIVNGQSPLAFKYQAVIRDNSGGIIADKSIMVRISIVQGSADGSIVYSELHNPATNSFGIINIEVGKGQMPQGTFSSIDWSGNTWFIRLEVDKDGGMNLIEMGTSQLLSVPYSLYSAKAGSAVALDAPGTAGQTLMHNGSDWSASSNLFNNGNNVGISTTNPSSKLDVNGDIGINGNLKLRDTAFIRHDFNLNNEFFGYKAGLSNSTGYINTFIGNEAGYSNTTGYGNQSVGYQAGYYNTTGYDNYFSGAKAGHKNTTGDGNCFVGTEAGYNNTSESFNTYIGYRAGLYNSGSNNTLLGAGAVIWGKQTNATAIGFNAKTVRSNSVVLGGTGSYAVNVGIGTSDPLATLHLAFSGFGSAYYGLAMTNTYTGGKTITMNQGTPGLLNFTEPGVLDLMTLNFTNGNIGIHKISPQHIIDVAGGAYCTGSKWVDASDSTLKRNIKTLNRYGLKDIMKLNPVEYYYKSDKSNKMEIGFIAQEIKNIIPEVVFGEEGNMGISYGSLVPVLVNAVKELKTENDELKAKLSELDNLKIEINNLKEDIYLLKLQVDNSSDVVKLLK